MNRLTSTVAALLVALGLAFTTAPAAGAADNPCEYSVPELPGECLTATVYARLVDLEAERDDALGDYADSRETVGVLRAENGQLRSELWEAGLARQKAEQATSMAQGALSVAYDWIDHQSLRITALRAKVKQLRHIIRDSAG